MSFTQRLLPRARREAATPNSRSAFSADGRLAVRATNAQRPLIISLEKGEERPVGRETHYVADVRVSQGWATVVDERGVQLVELATGDAKSLRIADAQAAEWFEPGVLLALVGGELVFLDAATGKPRGAALQKKVSRFAVSPTGVIATASDVVRAYLTLWQDRRVKHVVAPRDDDFQKHAPGFLSFSPDGTQLGFWGQPHDEGREARFAPRLRVVRVDDGADVVSFTHALEKLPGLMPSLGPSLLGFVMCSLTEGLIASTAGIGDRAKLRLQLSKVDLRNGAKPAALLTETTPGVDGGFALSAARVLLRSGVVYERRAPPPGKPAGPRRAWFDAPAPKVTGRKR